ncbi:galactose mutarotase-like domain-containing protein [Hyaloraphidium curvatum]|nr:galactose mutarotase-like domain-containing protein [Hyaloraphidium curvatum]
MPAKTEPDRVSFTHAATKSSAVVYLYGATLTSWKPGKDGRERIFVSPRAVLNGTKAIRGGIPLVFPQFGTVANSRLPQHGFARTSIWKWKGVRSEDSDHIQVAFELLPGQVSPVLFQLWPFAFVLTYLVTLRARTTYADKVRDGQSFTETDDAIAFRREVDRVYENVPGAKGRGANNSNPAEVVWNPHVEKARGMVDLGEDSYPRFVCVEAGQVASPVLLAPGARWEGTQTIRAL